MKIMVLWLNTKNQLVSSFPLGVNPNTLPGNDGIWVKLREIKV